MAQLVLFDLDSTLLECDSDHAWNEFIAEQELVNSKEYQAKNDQFSRDYQNQQLDIQAYLAFSLSFLAHKSLESLQDLRQQFFKTKILPHISPQAKNLVAQHRKDPETDIAIITATNDFLTRPIAQHFQIEHLIATQAEYLNQKFTGRYAGIPCFQDGKCQRLNQWLMTRQMQLENYQTTWFYSDSANDIPLLFQVDRAVAVKPDPKLRAYAVEHFWSVLDWYCPSSARQIKPSA